MSIHHRHCAALGYIIFNPSGILKSIISFYLKNNKGISFGNLKRQENMLKVQYKLIGVWEIDISILLQHSKERHKTLLQTILPEANFICE